jgi:hypothetical protein
MAANAALWKLHLICRRSHIPERFDADVHGKVRALADVTSVDSAPSHDASTRLVFSTPYAHAVVAAVAAIQCLHEAVDAHNGTGGAAESAAR